MQKVMMIVENTHEPIVSRELRERYNNLVKIKRQEYKETITGKVNIFADIVKRKNC